LILCGDCLALMREMPDDSVDLVLGSPPYEAARSYNIGFNLRGQDWVDWMVERIVEMIRVSRGLVAMVVEGQTRKFRWSATPALLMADLHRRGIHLRKPPIYARAGIPGSGGPDWLANRYEFIVCCSRGGRLPWSDNTAMGHAPKYPRGGSLSHRSLDSRIVSDSKPLPEIANPGNIISVSVGGGKMGHRMASEGEAPFHEKLAEFFVRSFCPSGGTVLDPFIGSGTTAAVAVKNGRKFIAIDIRQDQCDLTARRLADISVDHAIRTLEEADGEPR
jgi:DNA modification methylase